MSGNRKRTRHCGRYGAQTEHIQVSYFKYTERGTRQGRIRQRKFEVSTPKQRNLNEKRSKRYFEALVLSNFQKDDLHVTVTYDEASRPADIKTAMRQVDNFIKRLNYTRKRAGLPPVRYVCVTEEGAKGRIHHHFIMDGDLDRDTVEKRWGLGYCNADRIQPDRKHDIAPLIGYLSKDPKGRKRWSSSHNLVRPWDSINDEPRMMSNKKMKLMKDLPEDSEMMKKIIEADNPGYALESVEKEYREDTSQYYFFCRMKLAQSIGNVNKRVDNDKEKPK